MFNAILCTSSSWKKKRSLCVRRRSWHTWRNRYDTYTGSMFCTVYLRHIIIHVVYAAIINSVYICTSSLKGYIKCPLSRYNSVHKVKIGWFFFLNQLNWPPRFLKVALNTHNQLQWHQGFDFMKTKKHFYRLIILSIHKHQIKMSSYFIS